MQPQPVMIKTKLKDNSTLESEKDSQPNPFIDELECLRRVHVSRRTWFTWRRAGKIPAIKLGRRTLYHWASVEAALLRMQRGGTE